MKINGIVKDLIHCFGHRQPLRCARLVFCPSKFLFGRLVAFSGFFKIAGLLLLGAAMLSSCGPLRGRTVMSSSVGLKKYTVISGDLARLRGGKKLLVVGPFFGKGTARQNCRPETECLYPDNMAIDFISKYHDARRFAYGLQEAGLFETELYLQLDYSRVLETTAELKKMTGREIKEKFALHRVPEMILFGVVKKQDREIAPTFGVVVDVQYELEFYEPDSRRSVVVEAAVKGVFKEDMRSIIRETRVRLGMPDVKAGGYSNTTRDDRRL